MTNAFDLVKEGMKRAGVPAPLIVSTLQPWPETAIQLKLTQAVTAMSMKPLLVVLGPDSPRKDLFCAKIMHRYMLAKNKNGLWLTPAKIPNSYADGTLPNSGITVIAGVDILTPFQVTAIRQLLRDRLAHGATFILMVKSAKRFEGIFGKDSTEYLSHYTVMTEVETPNTQILKV